MRLRHSFYVRTIHVRSIKGHVAVLHSSGTNRPAAAPRWDGFVELSSGSAGPASDSLALRHGIHSRLGVRLRPAHNHIAADPILRTHPAGGELLVSG